MPYIGKSPTGSGVRQRFHFTATGGETSLSGADDNSKTLKFTDGEFLDVYLNGVLLVQGTDYGVGTTNTISSLAALSAGDIVEIIAYDIFNVAKINSEAIRERHYFTASGGETSIGTSQIGALSFAANADIDVSINGVTLVAGTDYNTTTANTVGGLSALTAGQVVEIVIYEKFQLADTVSKASGGTFSGAVAFNGGISNLIRIQTFTADGTYTKSSGATKALVYVVGGGGGGGGIDGQGIGSTGAGGGGGAGGMATKLITSGLGATESVTVGDGGSGGAGGSGGSNGSTGGTSSFGSHCSATGGGGGGGGTASAVSNATIRNGGTGGVGSSGDINTTGQPGSPGIAAGTSTSEAVSGNGGSTIFGGGARSVNGDQNGEDCADLTQAGGGGSGACNTDTSGNYRGGNGANGIVVVYEYLQVTGVKI